MDLQLKLKAMRQEDMDQNQATLAAIKALVEGEEPKKKPETLKEKIDFLLKVCSLTQFHLDSKGDYLHLSLYKAFIRSKRISRYQPPDKGIPSVCISLGDDTPYAESNKGDFELIFEKLYDRYSKVKEAF